MHGVQLAVDLGDRAVRVERHGDRTGAERTEVGDRELGRCPEHKCDTLACGDSSPSKRETHRRATPTQLAVSDRVAAKAERSRAVRMGLDYLSEIHLANIPPKRAFVL